MAESFPESRRWPRVAARCSARIALRSARFFASVTFDVGLGGCGLEAPWRLDPGERVFVEIGDPRLPHPAALAGNVAWASEEAPWRCGIEFDAASTRAATALFERLDASDERETPPARDADEAGAGGIRAGPAREFPLRD